MGLLKDVAHLGWFTYKNLKWTYKQKIQDKIVISRQEW